MMEQEQIEEIANELLAHTPIIDIPFETFNEIAAAVYNMGYRKASDVIDEFKNRILNEANLKLVNLDGEHKAIVDLADVLKIASEMRQEVENLDK